MSSPLPKRLGITAGMRGLVIGAPPQYFESLKPLPDHVNLESKNGDAHDFMQIFATRLSEIRDFARKLPKYAAPNALVWISYPKKTSGSDTDLNRDIIREEIAHFGWDTVAIIAINEMWSALRVRPATQVRSRAKLARHGRKG